MNTFNSFPVAAAAHFQGFEAGFQLSILSQLQPGLPPGLRARSRSSLSILSQLQQYEFDPYSVYAHLVLLSILSQLQPQPITLSKGIYVTIFQFFPSCSTTTGMIPAGDIKATETAFNSFPVAAVLSCARLDHLLAFAFNSFPVAAKWRERSRRRSSKS